MANISHITINNNSYDIVDAGAVRSVKTVNGLTITGIGDVSIKMYLGTCTTAANTYAKSATVETFPLDSNNKPLVGTIIGVKYSASNSYKTAGNTHTLNVNNTGDYPLYYNNAELVSTTSANTLVAGYKNRYTYYVFNGSQWVFVTASYDANSTYSAMTLAELDTGTGTTGRTITPKLIRDNIYTKSEIDNAGFLTSYTETDPTVPSWAKASTKPSYSYSEITNTPTLATVATSGSYDDLSNKPTIPTVPANVSSFNNDAGYLTSHLDITGKADLVNGRLPYSEASRVVLSVIVNSKLNYAIPETATEGELYYFNDEKKIYEIIAGATPLSPNTLREVGAPDSKLIYYCLGNSKFYKFDTTNGMVDITPTAPTNISSFTNDVGYLTSHQDISGKADVITIVTDSNTGSVSKALDPGKFYKFTGALTSLTLTLNAGTNGQLAVYAGKFTADSSGCTLSVPAAVTEAAQNPTISGGGVYEFNIADNVLLMVEI